MSLIQIRLESIKKSHVSMESTVAILMSFTCNDIYKFINQTYYNQVLWATSSTYQQKITIKQNGITFKFVNHQLWSPQKITIMIMVFSTTLISIMTKIIVTIIKVGDYNFRNNLSPTMDTSYISMMWYCSEPVSSQFCPRKRSHVSFHRNDLPHYFHMCPMQNAHVQGHCFHVF